MAGNSVPAKGRLGALNGPEYSVNMTWRNLNSKLKPSVGHCLSMVQLAEEYLLLGKPNVCEIFLFLYLLHSWIEFYVIEIQLPAVLKF